MEYVVYKLHFPAGVHFGAGALSDGVNTLPADTLFSALCQEAMAAQGPEGIEALVQAVRSSGLRLSDLFPFIGSELYLPKPLYPVKREENGDSIVKKSFKKLKYIPASQIGVYLQGDLNPLEQVDKLKQLGAFEMRTMAAGRSAEKIDTGDALPFSVGVYHFTEGNGLYFLAGFADSGLRETVENLLHALSFTGIGGKKSAGLGRFTVSPHEAPDDLTRRLAGSSAPCMSLSVCMAHAEQLEQVLHDAHYLLAKRSGFVDSASYAPEQRRKRDFYAFAAGSCFAARFDGDVYDVSNGGAHPVYRYAAPLWMEM